MRAISTGVVLLALVLAALPPLRPAAAAEWAPTAQQKDAANSLLDKYLGLMSAGSAEAAYGLMTESYRSTVTPADFERDFSRNYAETGKLTGQKVLHVEWLKDPPNSERPGVFAAIDITLQFERVHLYCGYVILFQAPEGGDFQVMRHEGNFISDAEVRKMGQALATAQWANLIQRCPNYPGR